MLQTVSVLQQPLGGQVINTTRALSEATHPRVWRPTNWQYSPTTTGARVKTQGLFAQGAGDPDPDTPTSAKPGSPGG